MEYKALITGNNDELIDEFFAHMDQIDTMTTSKRYADVAKHIKYFSPDVFVYCIRNESKEDYSRIVPLKHLLAKSSVPFVVAGSEEECREFERIAVNIADLTLHKPLDGDAIQKQLLAFLRERKPQPVASPQPVAQMPQQPVVPMPQQPMAQMPQPMAPMQPQPMAQMPVQSAAAVEAPAARKQPEPEKPEPKQQKPAPRRRRRRRTIGRGRILVVDDNPLMLKVIKEHLHEEYDVATAVSGRVGLRFLEHREVDLILLDYEMPEEDGASVLAKIRNIERLADVPVIFLTGVSDRKKIKKALAMKPDGYLLKPIDHEKLMSTIKKYVM